jgi:flagellar basal-body rod modification protein FlgD
MIQTSAIQTTSNQATTLQSAANKTMGQEAFLKLLIAQLQNQDPLNPVDNTQMIAQLAQFSQLEQAKQMTDSLNSFIQQQTNANANGLVSMIGRQVTASGSSVSLTSGVSSTLSYELTGNAAKVTVQVMNSAGSPVRTFNVVNQAAGNRSISWDGRSDNGSPLPAGTYTCDVSATGANGTAVTANTTNVGTVTGIRFNSSGPVMVLSSGQEVAPTQVLSVQ